MMHLNNKIHNFGIKNKDYIQFDDYDNKCSEITIIDNVMYCHSIKIESRYDKIREILQMIDFCQLAFKLRCCQFINALWFDSKANICSVYLQIDGEIIDSQDEEIFYSREDYYLIAKTVLHISNQTLSQHFVLGGCSGKDHQVDGKFYQFGIEDDALCEEILSSTDCLSQTDDNLFPF